MTKFTLFVQEEVPGTAEGPLVTLLLRRPKPCQADWTAPRHDMVTSSQTCAYEEGIKVCTAASFKCVSKLPKVTDLKCAKNSFVKKSGKKKAFLGNSASEAHLKYQDTFARHLPQTDGERNCERVRQGLSSFLWQVSGSSGCQLN